MPNTERNTGSPNRGPRAGLIALNAALLGALALVSLQPPAEAQQRNRNRGEYIVVGGEASSGNSNDVYVIDTQNQEMIAVRFDDGNNRLEGLGYRDLRADTRAQTAR